MRLINADAAKNEIEKYHDGLKPRYISKLVDAEIFDIQDIIDEQPTIDAVEVVRCKDCVFFREYSDTYKYAKADGECSIRCVNNYEEQFNDVTKDDYCSRGWKGGI